MTRRAALRKIAGVAITAIGVVGVAGHAWGGGWVRDEDDDCGGHEDGGHDRSGPRDPVVHPAPRPGITGDRVLGPNQVPRKSREVYEHAREFPEILDGLYCHCECARRDGLRSLLSCFETTMGATCGVCSGQLRLAYRLHGEGRSLDEIRAAVDERYGD